jgi:hypothetical protein
MSNSSAVQKAMEGCILEYNAMPGVSQNVQNYTKVVPPNKHLATRISIERWHPAR